jgi:iron complex outermembrane receptor protein
MNKLGKFFFAAIFFLFPIEIFGQSEIVIKGKVTDLTGNPLVDANISIVNESYGSSTDRNGNYVFKIPDSYIDREVAIEVRYVGFITQSLEIKLASGNNIYDFLMEKDVLSVKPVIVTAQRREENIQEVPISITTLDNKEIKSRGIDRAIDLQYSVPNFFFGDGTFNYSAPSSIRGISGSSRASGVEARTNYYINDIYIGRSVAVNQDLFDLERIEILKGPQGTLFGKNTVSGVINITARKPFNGWEGTVGIDAGSFNYLNTNIIINAPLIDNDLFVRFSGKIMRTDGYVTNLFNNKDYNRQNIMNGRLQLRYLPTPNIDIIVRLNVLRDRRPHRIIGIALDGPGYDAAPGSREVSHDLNEFEHRDIFGGSLNMVYQLSNNYSIKSITGFRKIKNWGNLDEDLSPKAWVVDNFKNEDAHFTQEFRLISPLLKNFNFVTGLFYFYQSSDFMFDLKTSPTNPLPNFSLLSEGPVKSNSIAGYFHGNFNITNNLALFGGLRYTYEYKKVNWDQMNNLGLYINLKNYTDTYSKGVFSPQIGLRYNPFDLLMLYAKISWGYKSGGWGNFTVWKIEDLKLRPEYSVGYEAGTKFTTLNNKLSFNAAAFLNKFDDFQTEIWKDAPPLPPPVTAPETLPVYTNAAKVTSKGFELELIAAPLNNISLFSSLGYVDATYDEFIIPSERNYNGHKLEFAPETEYNISLEYMIPVTNIGTFIIRGDFIHKDDYYFDASNTEDYHIAGYDLIDGKTGYESNDGSLGIYLWGKNLSDKLYMLTRAILPLGVKYTWYGAPRTFGIQVTYRFLNL